MEKTYIRNLGELNRFHMEHVMHPVYSESNRCLQHAMDSLSKEVFPFMLVWAWIDDPENPTYFIYETVKIAGNGDLV